MDTRARLHLVAPRNLAQLIELGSEELTLGRERCTVSLAVASLSRHHLTVSWDAAAGTHLVTDRESKHGTFVNGKPLEGPTPLAPHDVLRAADVVMVYERVGQQTPETTALPGASAAAHQLRAELAHAAPDSAPVLIIGATGVGKELVANEVHRLSGRKGPFLAVNCAALAPQLAESQLFGHVKGAFTGADAAGQGLFRAANGGTLFLDEIGELSSELQPKLLRALQQREVLPVGSTTPVKVDVRVVAATNRDLAKEVEAGTFRRDLHARLALWEVRVPALTDRRADVVGWIDRLRARWETERGAPLPPLALEAEAVEAILLAPLSDNLRGLDRLVHQLGARREPVAVEDLPGWLLEVSPPAAAHREANVAPEKGPKARRPSPSKDELAATLAKLGSVRATAKHYDRDRRQIYRWIEAYELDFTDGDPDE